MGRGRYKDFRQKQSESDLRNRKRSPARSRLAATIVTATPYVLCCCGSIGSTDPCVGCGSCAVFANSPEEAVRIGAPYCEEPDHAEARGDDRLEPLRVFGEHKALSPYAPTLAEARIWRKVGWGDQREKCNECDLCVWDTIPESVLDEEGYCKECPG